MSRRHLSAVEIPALAALGLGAAAGMLGLAILLSLTIPDGRYALCLEVEDAVVTLHTDASACAAPTEIREP